MAHVKTGTRAKASNKSVGALLRQAERQGWTATGGGSSHYRLRCPNRCKCQATVGSSISNSMALLRLRTRLANHTCWKDSQ